MAFIMVSALVLGRVCAFGLDDATSVLLARRVGQRPVLLANALSFFAIASALAGAAVVGVLLALPAARPAGVEVAEVFAIGAATVACSFLVAGYACLTGLSRFRWQAVGTAVAPWFYAVVLFALWRLDRLTVRNAAISWTAAIAVWAGALLVGAVRGVGVGRPDAHLLAESLRFALRAWGSGLFRFLNFRADQLLLAFLSTEAALGVYAVAVNSSEVLLYLPAAAATALLPALSSDDQRAFAVQRAVRIFRGLVAVTGVLAAVSAAVAPTLLPLIFGSDFEGSVTPFLWLIPGAFGFAALALFSSGLVAAGAPFAATRSAFASLVVGIALDLVLIPSHGATGAAIAASAAFAAGGVFAAVSYRRWAHFEWKELVPRRSDVEELGALARQGVRGVLAR